MKYLLTIISIVISSNMTFSQNTNDLDLAVEFITIISSNEPTKFDDISNYLSINEKAFETNDGQMYKVVEMNIVSLNKKLKSCNGGYVIKQHFSTNENILDKYLFDYSNLNNVYHVECNGDVITSIIIEEDKIVSFFTYLRKTENQKVVPWIL